MKINFKLANKQDFEEIISHSKGWDDWPPNKSSFQNLINSKSYYLVFCDKEIAWSFSYIQIRDDTIMVQFLRIKKSQRRKWIATKILEYINELWKQRWCDSILSTVRVGNDNSIKFHENTNFEESWIIRFKPEHEKVFLRSII